MREKFSQNWAVQIAVSERFWGLFFYSDLAGSLYVRCSNLYSREGGRTVGSGRVASFIE